MATTSSESDSSRKNTENKENENKDEQNNMFECNICLDNAKDAVVSVCGHLFWLVTELYCYTFILLLICIYSSVIIQYYII